MPPKGSKLVRAHYRNAAATTVAPRRAAKHAGAAKSTIEVRKTVTVQRTTIQTSANRSNSKKKGRK